MTRKTLLSHYHLNHNEYKALEALYERERSSTAINGWELYLELIRLIESMDEELGRLESQIESMDEDIGWLESQIEDCDCE